jgi:hypothetical protein
MNEWNICYFYWIIHSLQHCKSCSSKTALKIRHENTQMMSNCLQYDSILVNTFQQHPVKFIGNIWITTEQNSLLLPWIFSLINEHKKLTKYYMPQWRLWNGSRMALLCIIPWEGCMWWGWWHCKKVCSNHIMAPHQPCEWSQSSLQNLNFDFVTENACKEKGPLIKSICSSWNCVWNSVVPCIYAS